MAISSPAADIEAVGQEPYQSQGNEEEGLENNESDKAIVTEHESAEDARVVEATNKPHTCILTQEEIEDLPSMQILREDMNVMNRLSSTLCKLRLEARNCVGTQADSSNGEDMDASLEKVAAVVRHFQDIISLKLINGPLKKDFNGYIVLSSEYKQLLRAYHDNLDLNQLDTSLCERLKILSRFTANEEPEY